MVQIEPILDHNKDVVYFLHHSFIGNQQLPNCSPLLHLLLFYFFETILYFVFQFRDMNYHYTPSQIVRYFIIAMYNPVSSANIYPALSSLKFLSFFSIRFTASPVISKILSVAFFDFISETYCSNIYALSSK